MYFKLEHLLCGQIFVKDETFEIVLHNTYDVKVKIEGPKRSTQDESYKANFTTSNAFLEQSLSKENEKILDDFLTNNVREGVTISLPSPDKYPQPFVSSLDNIRKELEDSSKKVIDTFLWRLNILVPQKPISSGGLYWSKDQISWYNSPLSLGPKIAGVYAHTRRSDNTKQDIAELITNKCPVPIHHELFREAWEQKNNNPRSSLVIGISSLEAAIQTTIGRLIPDASWLIENIPSPPVVTILKNYLPQLPTRNNINGKALPPPQEIKKLIDDAVKIRNKIVHSGAEPPDNNTLYEMLRAVQDVIWLLDYYCGHEWASQFIRKETWDKLIAMTKT